MCRLKHAEFSRAGPSGDPGSTIEANTPRRPAVAARNRVTTRLDQESRELTEGASPAFLVASDPSIEAALEPVKLFKCVGKRVGDLSSRLSIQAIGLD